MTNSAGQTYVNELFAARDFILGKKLPRPEIALVLGSGLGSFGKEIDSAVIIPYSSIPHFPTSSAAGHAGNLVLGKVSGKNVIAMQGRCHQYEGHSAARVAFGVRTLALLGAKTLIVTNAAGGLALSVKPGDLMVLNNLIGFMSDNPSAGINHEVLGPQFYDVSHPFDKDLITTAKAAFAHFNIPYHEGVYAWTRGPAYETAAEIKALRTMGADAVGMSTVPEVLAARQMGVRVLGISLITNLAAGVSPTPLNHEEVIQSGKEAAKKFQALVKKIIADI